MTRRASVTIAGTAGSFNWQERDRSVILLQVDHDNYRIIYDPRSELNTLVFATVTIVA